MRTVHRFIAVIAVLFALYIASTGIVVQLMDLRALFDDAPASDPTMQAIRVGIDGPPNFQVISEADYSAAEFPSGFNFNIALDTTVKSGRAVIGDAAMSFIELRMLDGRPVGQVASQGQLLRFDLGSGAVLGDATKVSLPPLSTASPRNTVKDVHRMRVFGRWALIVDALAGFLLLVMVFTGLVLYFQLLKSRVRMGRTNPFWLAGGWWRSLHRAISVMAALFLTILALSGIVLATSSVGVAIHTALQGGQRPGLTADVSSPLVDAELPALLHTTLSAYQSSNPNAPVKVLRLRYFAGMPQGVIITGGPEVRQVAYNAATGEAAGLSGPGYPETGMTFGWQVTQIAKKIHRGDIIGLPGRWMNLFAGLSLLYLAISGAVIYFELWSKRRQRGRRELFWS